VRKDAAHDTLTLIFDRYNTYLYPANRSDLCEAFCPYEVTVLFPEGCTEGTVYANPGGTLRPEKRFEGKFKADYTLSPSSGNITSPPPEVFNYDYDFPANTWTDWSKEHPIGVKVIVQPGGQRTHTFTARSRIQLQAPGISATESSAFGIDQMDIGVRDMVTC